MYKFRLLPGAGPHIDTDPETGKDRVYKPGDEFVTKTDLRTQDGENGMSKKFELIEEQGG